MNQNLEIIFYWAATALYAISFIAFITGYVFRKEKVSEFAGYVLYPAILIHAVSIGGRWIRVGHGPYINLYEVMSSNSILVAFLFLVLRKKLPAVSRIAPVVMGLVTLSMGFGVMSSPRDIPLPPSLRSFWLVLHVVFAKLAYGSLIIAFAYSVYFLILNAGGTSAGGSETLEKVDMNVYRFNLLGFSFCTVMIVAGSIWAKNAWGRYWAFDPVETWALITWLAYGLYLHLRLNRGWQGVKSAWGTVALFVIMVLSFFIVPYAQKTLHTEYLVR